jgi:preprotein translocase subunit SecB
VAQEIALHPLQLADVWLDSASFRRRPRDESAELTPPVVQVRVGRAAMAPEPTSFTVILRLSLSFAIDAKTEFAARLAVAASFVSDEPLATAPVGQFVRRSSLYVIWPFARAQFASLARQAGVAAPSLPLLIRPERIQDGNLIVLTES